MSARSRTQAQAVVTFIAEVTDAEDAPGDIDFSWTSDVDGEFSTSGANSSGIAQLTTSDLRAHPPQIADAFLR